MQGAVRTASELSRAGPGKLAGMLARVRLAGLILLAVAAPAPAGTVRLTIDPAAQGPAIAGDFLGFGYETAAVAQPGYFSAGNGRLVRLYRNLSDHGLIRIGGNVSDHTRYDPDGPAEPRPQSGVTVINRACLDDLGRFARATGWRVLWGLNLGTGSKEMAAAEATAVAAALGDRLQSFQIGNEVDGLRRFGHDYGRYHAAFAEYKAAVRAAVPHAAFSGPDDMADPAYLTRFAADEAADMDLLTLHYYRGDARDKAVTLEQLLSADPGLPARLDRARRLCDDDHLTGYRVCEVNSFSGGGKPGVSDTAGSALWCLDFCFVLAAHGCEGVNLETDVNHLGWVSHYSPIVHDAAAVCSARPEYYGLLAFAAASRGTLLRVQPEVADVNATAYATREGGRIVLTVVNKDAARDAAVEAAVPAGVTTAAASWLRAPSLEARAGVTFADRSVADDGTFVAGPSQPVVVTGGSVRLVVPHGSAAVVRLSP